MLKKFLTFILAICLSLPAWAQCVVCTKTASELGTESAKSLNTGIIYLAMLPLGILGTLGFVWYRKNKDSI